MAKGKRNWLTSLTLLGELLSVLKSSRCGWLQASESSWQVGLLMLLHSLAGLQQRLGKADRWLTVLWPQVPGGVLCICVLQQTYSLKRAAHLSKHTKEAVMLCLSDAGEAPSCGLSFSCLACLFPFTGMNNFGLGWHGPDRNWGHPRQIFRRITGI